MVVAIEREINMSDLTELVVAVGRLNMLRQSLEAIKDGFDEGLDRREIYKIVVDCLSEDIDDEVNNMVVGWNKVK